ncbi:MAG: tRNA dihydrouridine synthase DusB [Planctomycetota bacterium]
MTTHPFSVPTKQSLKIARRGAGEYPLALQICGNEPDLMSKCIHNANKLGYELVDLNAGCPVRRMVSRGYGGGLMRNPALVGELLRVMVRESVVPVTVKIRAGFDEESINAVEVAKIAEDAGVSLITVHGRTVKQMYSGTADYGIIARVKQAVSVPVVGNGDVLDGPSALRLLNETGCDGIMVGRGALGRPWVFRQILDFMRDGEETPPPSREEIIGVVRRHAKMLTEHFGPKYAPIHMRRFLCQYARGLAYSHEFKRKCQSFGSMDSLEQLLTEFPGEYLYRTKP